MEPGASFKLSDAATQAPNDAPDKRQCKKQLAAEVEELSALQEVIYAHNRYSILLVFQAMDAAGKDGTLRAVMSGVNPAGCQVFSFKQPSNTELDHDFLWRTARHLPERGRIGIFNRSYYEEVLAVRVHPEYLQGQRIDVPGSLEKLWQSRCRSINDHEYHLAQNGTLILKFWLNVSRDEQRARFLSRLDEPHKHWKFSSSDIAERAHWDTYMQAHQDTLSATSQAWAPWYAMPADNKHFLRLEVARTIVKNVKQLDASYPKVSADDTQRFEDYRQQLLND